MNAQSDLTSAQPRSQLKIEPRKVQFDFSTIDRADFFGGNLVSSAFYTALSITFPAGEAEFIASVRHFSKHLKDPDLIADVKSFVAQEAHHGLQHIQLNKQLGAVGYPVAKVEALVEEKLAQRRMSWSPAKRLRRTVSAEHFTASMAHQALTDSETLDVAPQVFKDLMLWHAIEEVEHKSVAFDVYQQCIGDMRALRLHYLYFACVDFPLQYWMITRFLLKEGGFTVTWKERREFLRLLFGKKGIYGSVIGQYITFLKKGFHPWQQDDAHLVNKWKEKLSPYFVGVTSSS